MILNKEEMEDIFYSQSDKFKTIKKQFCLKNRWANLYLCVFEDNKELYGFYVEEALTEMQETEFLDGVFKVIEKQITKTIYNRE
jgi:hypothetical protein